MTSQSIDVVWGSVENGPECCGYEGFSGPFLHLELTATEFADSLQLRWISGGPINFDKYVNNPRVRDLPAALLQITEDTIKVRAAMAEFGYEVYFDKGSMEATKIVHPSEVIAAVEAVKARFSKYKGIWSEVDNLDHSTTIPEPHEW